ncbi:rhomboid-related protein 4-like isoform X1 [Melanotaenia boesemani]|uniref:rhomboid-related protein 4-like isoform X1 n=2 Tax=Melanotaenia boesemani TaxID=1250792 RepID=UPI001C051472|nr:rhomboid-related protein 4-like isoform X1 [Melanotaenia boesemani]
MMSSWRQLRRAIDTEDAVFSMQRGFQVGLPLLVIQLFQEGLGNIPPITMAVFGFNVYLYVFPPTPSLKACVSLHQVYRSKEWHRLFLSPLHHVDDWHLYANMVSFLWKGSLLERHLGGGWFLYLLSVFSLLSGLVYLLLQALMLKVIDWSDRLLEYIDLPSYSSECVVGFSGVLFALKVVSNHFNPGGVTLLLNIRVSNRFASWVELVLIHLIVPGTSLVGHLAGILVGLLYTVGPLKIILETCAELLTSGGINSPLNSSSNSSDRGRGDTSSDDRHPTENRNTEDASDYSEYDIAGLTEEEQIEMAIRNSLKNKEQTRQRETQRTREEKEDEGTLEERTRKRCVQKRGEKTVVIE